MLNVRKTVGSLLLLQSNDKQQGLPSKNNESLQFEFRNSAVAVPINAFVDFVSE
jgi:hypothetical protein